MPRDLAPVDAGLRPARRGWPARRRPTSSPGAARPTAGRSMRISSCGAVNPARTLPRSSTRSARVPPVPISIPIHMNLGSYVCGFRPRADRPRRKRPASLPSVAFSIRVSRGAEGEGAPRASRRASAGRRSPSAGSTPPLSRYSGKLKMLTSMASATPSDSPIDLEDALGLLIAGHGEIVDVLRGEVFAQAHERAPWR